MSMIAEVKKLLEQMQQLHRAWVRDAEHVLHEINPPIDLFGGEDLSKPLPRHGLHEEWTESVLHDFGWYQAHIEASVVLLNLECPHTATPQLRLLKDEGYYHAAVNSGAIEHCYAKARPGETRDQFYERLRGLKTRALAQARDHMQSGGSVGEEVKRWGQSFNHNIHGSYSFETPGMSEFNSDDHFVFRDALLVFWIHHRLLSCLRIQDGSLVQRWRGLDNVFVEKMTSIWGQSFTRHFKKRLRFDPEDDVFAYPEFRPRF